MDKLENTQEKKNKIVRSAAQTAVLMAILTLGSKCLGFVREMVMANYFGTSYVVDAYVMAQSIPEIVFAGVFGSIATSFMPLFSNRIEKEGEKSGNVFTSQIILILLIFSLISAIIGIIFSSEITSIFAKGFAGETAKLTTSFLRITFSYVIFTSIAGILEAYIQYKNVFIPQILIGYTQSTIVIITIVFSAFTSAYYLIFGLLLAYFVRMILLWRLARKNGYKYEQTLKNVKPLLKEILTMAIPVFLGNSVYQINLFVDKYLASELQEGSVAALNYANILNTMIMALTVSILTTIIYPRLAQANALDDTNRASRLIQSGVNLIIIIALPFSLGAIIYSEQIVQIIFERGAFDRFATSLTGSAYMFYSVGMVFMALNSFLTRVYYAVHDMKTPVISASVSVIINIGLNIMLVGKMQHNGLALATSVVAILNTIWLYWGLRIRHNKLYIVESWEKIIKFILISVLAVASSYLIYIFIISIIWMPRIIYLGIAVLIAVLIYFALLWLFRIEELNILKAIIKR